MNILKNGLGKDLLKLSASERAIIAELLLESLEPSSAETDQAWADEAERRVSAYDQGKLAATDASLVHDRLQKKYE